MIRPTKDHPTEQRHLLTQKGWSQGWEGHELDQLRRTAAWPLRQKIKWLEEAQRITMKLEAGRAKARPMFPGPIRSTEIGK